MAHPHHRPPRLLLACHGEGVGGTERIALGLARGFTNRGWEVRTVFPEHHREQLSELGRSYGVDVRFSPAVLGAHAARSLRRTWALRSLVREERPDVVNLHYPGGHGSIKDALAARSAGRHQVVVTVHHPTDWSVAGSRNRRSTRLVGRMADAVVANSRATWAHLRRAKVQPGKLRLVHCGVMPPSAPVSRSAARSALGISDDAFVVGALGRLVRYKGYYELVEAVARLAANDPSIRLLIAGDGREREGLEAAAADRLGDRAAVLGRVADQGQLYAASDVFALPSEIEGFGLVYIEAAFYGIPSVALDTAGVPDAIADGVSGLLLPNAEIDGLAEAIARLRNDAELRQEMGEAARRRALATFTEERMVDGYEAVFRERQGRVAALVSGRSRRQHAAAALNRRS